MREWCGFADALWSLRAIGKLQHFTDEISQALWQASGGVPHFAFLMFDAAHREAFARHEKQIDLQRLASVGKEDIAIGHFVEDILAQHNGEQGRYDDVRFIRRPPRLD